MALSRRQRILRTSSTSTNQSRTQKLNQEKKKLGLGNVPANYFETGATGNMGIFGFGPLKPRPNRNQDYQNVTDSKGRTVISSKTVANFSYFFVNYGNIFTPRTDGYLDSFVVIKTVSPTTRESVSTMMGVSSDKVTPLTEKGYLTGSFTHPKYTNQNGSPLRIRYASITILDQKTAGRLDDIGIGYPNFDSTPSTVSSTRGPIPSRPVVNFTSVTGATASVTVQAGGTVYFVDASVWNPASIRPENWLWSFGTGGTPSTSSSRNQIVKYPNPGNYTVQLTAWNFAGTGSKIKTGFVTVT